MAYGFAGYIGVAREVSWGSAVAATDFVEALNENLTRDIDRFDYKNIIGTMATPDDIAGINRYKGTIAFAVNPVNFGYFLMSCFNTVSISSVTSGFTWNHRYTQPTTSNSAFSSDAPSLPLTVDIFRDVTTAVRYAGNLVSALTLSFNPNQEVRATVDLIGRSDAFTAKVTPTFPGSPAKPFTFDTCSISLGGAASALFESLTIKIDNKYDGIPTLDGTTYVNKIRRTSFQSVTIDGTVDFTNMTEYVNFINQTQQALTVNVTKAASYAMTVIIPNMVYTSFPLGMRGKDRITVGFNAKGFYNSSSGTGISIDLTTTKSYY